MNFTFTSINRAIRILLLFLFVINTAAALWTPLFSVYVLKNVAGITMALYGLTGALYSVVKATLQIPIAKHLDMRAGERDDFIVIFIGICLASVCSFALLFMHSIWQLGIVQALWGVADACTLAAYFAIFSHHIDSSSAAFEWSLYNVGGATIAIALGGIVGGYMADAFGFQCIFFVAGIMNVLALLLLAMLYPYLKIMRPAKELAKSLPQSAPLR
jgi:MFS family permease